MWRVPWYVGWPLALALAYAALSFLARRSVYYPSKYPEGFWDLQARLGAADVRLETADGVRIHGWFVRAGRSRPATLFLHGNAGNLTHRSLHFREITAAGSSVLMIDYRGYGKSGGRPTERGLEADADAGYEYLRRSGYGPEEIVVHGESLGTAIAVELASRRRCGAVILEAPFTSAKDVAATVLPIVGPILIGGFDSRRRIGRVRAPVLVMHGAADEIIPVRLGEALFAAAAEPKTLWVAPGAGHNHLVEAASREHRQRPWAVNQHLGSVSP